MVWEGFDVVLWTSLQDRDSAFVLATDFSHACFCSVAFLQNRTSQDAVVIIVGGAVDLLGASGFYISEIIIIIIII